MNVSSIVLRGIVKEFVAGSAAVNGVDLEIDSGEFFVLVGPSGCGKTTLLRLIAGLERPTAGSIHLGGRDVTQLAPRDRDVAMVFQNYALYPQMSVRANIGYGLKVRGLPKKEIEARVTQVAKLLALEPLLDRRPATLSGGQRQRVAMGRAIAREPQAYLMDEPLSNLDAKLRVSMRAELEALHQRLGVTTVYVTHDQVEAMTLGMRAAVLRDGVLQQVDTPQALYSTPTNAFVAAFVGSPSMNFAIGVFEAGELSFAGFRVPVPDRIRPAVQDGEQVLVGIRPEDFVDPRFAPEDATQVRTRVAVRDDLGHETLLYFPVESDALDADVAQRLLFEQEQAEPRLAEAGTRLFCARVAAGLAVLPGGEVNLAVAPESLHFFDLATGMRLAAERVLVY